MFITRKSAKSLLRLTTDLIPRVHIKLGMDSRDVAPNIRLSQVLRHISSNTSIETSKTLPASRMTESHPKKETVAIVGTGWAGWTLSQEICDNNYDVIVISPERTVALTPLLASAACGIFDFRIAEEPVRRRNRFMQKIQASVSNVDFEKQSIYCQAAIPDYPQQNFEVKYDKLILAPGCAPNTFGTPGVMEHAYMLKSVRDAQAVRARILDMFEIASLPTLSEQERRDILHIAIVGGGPTGVEMAAEVDDMINDHLYAVYPRLKGLASIAIHDVASQILAPFDQRLSEYALSSFERRNVQIKTNSHIEKVEKDAFYTKEDGKIPIGMLVWATGNKQVELVDNLTCKKSEKLPRILTDKYLCVLKPDSTPLENVFALGDAADIDGTSLPTTAEVAVQKAHHLAKFLNGRMAEGEFGYKDRPMVAYIGGHDGVVHGEKDWTGPSAWLAWRNGSLEWTRSYRRKAMIWIYWTMNWLDGREISRK